MRYSDDVITWLVRFAAGAEAGSVVCEFAGVGVCIRGEREVFVAGGIAVEAGCEADD